MIVYIWQATLDFVSPAASRIPRTWNLARLSLEEYHSIHIHLDCSNKSRVCKARQYVQAPLKMEKPRTNNDRTNSYHNFLTRDNEAEENTIEFDSDLSIQRQSASSSTDRGAANMASWSGQPTIKGSTEAMRMALLTFSLAGLQYVLKDGWKSFAN
jgi:hypothetical protein